MHIRSIFCLILAVCVSTNAVAGDTLSYKLVKTVVLGDPERWDYLVYDETSHKVFVAHGDHLSVVDGRTGAILGNVGPFPGATHGTAIVSGFGEGFTDDGKAGVAGAFDLATLKVIKLIPAESDADGVAFDPASDHVFVTDGDSGHLTVIDPATDGAVATINAGGGLEYSAVDGRGRLFVNGVENSDLVVIDTATNAVVAHYPLPGCVKPHGLAIDVRTERLFSSCANGVLVVTNANTGANVATLPIGNGTDAAAFDPSRNLVFSSNGDGTVTIIRENSADNFSVAGTLKTFPGARTMTVDPESGRLFLVTAAVASVQPSSTPGGRPHVNYVPGSTRIVFYDPL